MFMPFTFAMPCLKLVGGSAGLVPAMVVAVLLSEARVAGFSLLLQAMLPSKQSSTASAAGIARQNIFFIVLVLVFVVIIMNRSFHGFLLSGYQPIFSWQHRCVALRSSVNLCAASA